MSGGLHLFQWINVVMFTIIVFVGIYWWKMNNNKELYSLPLIIYGLHGLVFYWAVEFERIGLIPLRDFDDWSAGLRMNGLLTILIMSYVLIRLRKRARV